MYSSANSVESLSDEELVSAYLSGDELAFAILVQRYTPLIRAQSSYFSVSLSEYEDLKQEGMLGLLSAVRAFEPQRGRSFRSFALVCSRNRMLSSVRNRHVVVEPMSDEELAAFPSELDADPAHRLQKQEDTANLRRWLHNRLSKLEYPVLYLFLNGQSYEQIAEALSVTEKAVDNALQRIRKKIGNTFL
ncbi:MAG: sigma-70 family RNA polymerase sigma factor [Clostridia bacterium]|nr:sigma-70 family RNA polymerase sigma factor [Clostridia bacterium]